MTFEIPAEAIEARERVQAWVELLESPAGMEQKETELLPDFLTDIFQQLLGYGSAVERIDGRYTISREALIEADGHFADAALGSFTDHHRHIVVALEGKGPKDPLDRPHAGRGMSAVDQAYRYAINAPCDWIIVTNLREIRIYHKGSTQRTFERFRLRDVAANEDEFRRLVFILGAERVVPREGQSHLDDLLNASEQAGEKLTQEYYRAYADIRHDLLNSLLDANPKVPPADALRAAQRLLDRALFVAFAEDRFLLPQDTLFEAYEHRDPYNPRPIWENFRGLFRSIDQGNSNLNIPRYNGGLFAEHPLLDHELVVPDHACELLKRLGAYHYGAGGHSGNGEGRLVDVEILGHIFEQSIEDLEAIRAEIEGGGSVSRATSRRKREGVFYTPPFVTRYIVSRTLRPMLDENFERLRTAHQEKATGTAVVVMADPRVYIIERLNNPQRDALIAFWEAWVDELKTVRVLDPACGSGAFLIEVFDQLHVEYQHAVDRLAELRRGGFAGSLFDPDRAILQHNIYGLDVNSEAIEIARLSIWIKTAQRGKILTDLNHNIRVGNSIVADPEVDSRAFDWWDAFPEVAEQGGFDAVVGNPPYVRAEMLTAIKPYLEKHYKTHHGAADLYVYFYELGVRLLRPNGRLSYIVTNKWLRAGYAEPLRTFFGEATWIEEIVDLGHAKEIFPDADVFPCILRVRKPDDRDEVPASTSACVIPRDDLDISDLPTQVQRRGFDMPRSHLGSAAWSLEPPAVARLMEKIEHVGVPLKQFAGVESYRGVVTGMNAAFLVDSATRERLVAEHPSSEEIIRPYFRGQDVDRWTALWNDRWMVFVRRGTDISAYPAVERYLAQFRKRLEPKPVGWEGGRWPGRKAGNYKWYEIQDAVDYFQEFDKPKIIYQEIQFRPAYALDTAGRLLNNKCFLISSQDLYLLAVLNSPLMWWYNWRTLPHMKDEALSPVGYRMDALPIAEPTATQRRAAEGAASELIEMARNRHRVTSALHDWLRVEFGIEKPGQKLSAPYEMNSDEFVAAVKQRRAGKARVSSNELQRLRLEYEGVIAPLQEEVRRALIWEGEISDVVNDAYRLTPDEIGLLWRTAPPRIPAVARAREP